MRIRGQAALFALSIAAPAVLFGQDSQGLSITNYQVVSQSSAVRINVTYRADLVNSGGPLGSVTATLTSRNPYSFKVVPGQDTLNFAPVRAKSQVTSSNTFTILVDPTVPFNFSDLQWSFQTTPPAPVANAGPHQSVKVGDTVILDGSGSTDPLSVGPLTYNWVFALLPVGSNAVLNNPTSVRPSFVADISGNYVVILTVSNGLATNVSSVLISTVYTPPVAKAGPNQTVTLGSTAMLNGSASSDVNGLPLTYKWSLTAVPADSTAALAGANTVSPTFVLDKPGNYVATLVVNDGTSDSSPSTVTITTQNSPPVANAGSNQVIQVGSLVQLDGSGSTDVDGDPLTYKWTLLSAPTGSLAALSNPAAVNPTFTADIPGTYVAQLIVNDGLVDSPPSTIMVTTNTVVAPTANAGPNQTVGHRSLVLLNGSGVDPQGLPLTFQWALLTKPTGSTAVLANSSTVSPTFFADVPGTYVAQLIASNGFLNSAPATVTITTTNTPPVANAGPNQNILVGASVKLDASGSFDADRDPLTYAWSLLSSPIGSNAAATFSGANTVAPTFTADVPGTYVAQLVVNDGFSNSLTPSTVTISAVQNVAITLAPNPLNFSTATPGVLTLTIGVPAGPNGQVINLTSFNSSIASVPSSVTVPAGATGTNVTVSSGGTPGSTAIFATAPGFSPRFVTATSVAASITLGTDAGTVGLTRSMSGSITLSVPAPAGGLTVALSANPSGILDVEPATIMIPGGSTTGVFTITGLGLGPAVITANSPAFISGLANVNVGLLGFIALPHNITDGLHQFVSFPINLATPAPTGGVTITLTSDNPSKVGVLPSTIFIPFKATTPTTQPALFGVNLGSANISAFAPGFSVSNPTVVQVTGTFSFSPMNLTINGTITQNITLTLSGSAPVSGLTVNLKSDNPGVATVPATVVFPPFGTAVTVPVTAVAAGSTLIHASALPNVGDIAVNVTVLVVQ